MEPASIFNQNNNSDNRNFRNQEFFSNHESPSLMSESFRLSLNELRNSLVPDIVPLELYNHKKSRLRCSIAWLLNHVFQGRVPLEYEDPLIDEAYVDEESSKQLELNPSVAALLTSGRAYADACRLILRQQPQQNTSLQTLHGPVLLLLNQCGFYPLSDDPLAKNGVQRLEAQLALQNPFKASIHQGVIDALQKAYLALHYSSERILGGMREFAASMGLDQPRSTEEALLFWISKVCQLVRTRLAAERRLLLADLARRSGNSTVRLQQSEVAVIPLVKDLLADISDGAALATLVCHYTPDHLRIGDVALKEPLGVADSCFNLEIVRLFSDHLDRRVYFFRLEDLLYMHSSFKTNVLVFLSELFGALTQVPLLCQCSRPLPNENLLMNASSRIKQQNLLNGVDFSNDFSNNNDNHLHEDEDGNFEDLMDQSVTRRSWGQSQGTMVMVGGSNDIVDAASYAASKNKLFVKHHRDHHNSRRHPRPERIAFLSSSSHRAATRNRSRPRIIYYHEQMNRREEDEVRVFDEDFGPSSFILSPHLYPNQQLKPRRLSEPDYLAMMANHEDSHSGRFVGRSARKTTFQGLSRSMRLTQLLPPLTPLLVSPISPGGLSTASTQWGYYTLPPLPGTENGGLLAIVPGSGISPSAQQSASSSYIIGSTVADEDIDHHQHLANGAKEDPQLVPQLSLGQPVLSNRQSTSVRSSAGASSSPSQTHRTTNNNTTSYTVSNSRQFHTAESAAEAGLPVVIGGSNGVGAEDDDDPLSSPRSLKSGSEQNNQSVRITWAQLQQQQKQNRQATKANNQHEVSSVDNDFEVEQIVNQPAQQQNGRPAAANGLGARSHSFGSLSLKLQLAKRRQEQEQLSRQNQQEQAARIYGTMSSSNNRRQSDQSSQLSYRSSNNGSASLYGTLGGSGLQDEGYKQRLEQLNQSLSDLHHQLTNLSSPRSTAAPAAVQKPVAAYHQQTVTQAQPVMMQTAAAAVPAFVQLAPANQGAPTPMLIYQTAPGTAIAYASPNLLPQAQQYQSTQSLLLPGPKSAFHHSSTFSMAGQPQQPSPHQQPFFVPISGVSSNGAPSVIESTGSSSQGIAAQQLRQQLMMEQTQMMLDYSSNLDESLANVSLVRRSQSLSALQNRLASNGSSASLAPPVASPKAPASVKAPGSSDQEQEEPTKNDEAAAAAAAANNIAFVVGDMPDADELERRRKQKCIEMEIKRKLESNSKAMKEVGQMGVLSQREVEAAKQREVIRQQQEEQEKWRAERRLKQQKVFEEYKMKKQNEAEQQEISKMHPVSKTPNPSSMMTKSKSRDALSAGSKSAPKAMLIKRTPKSEHENLATLAASPPGTPAGKSVRKPPGALSSRHASQLDFGSGQDQSDAGSIATTAHTADVLAISTVSSSMYATYKKSAPSSSNLLEVPSPYNYRPVSYSPTPSLRSAKSCSSLKVTPSVPLRVQPSAKSNRNLIYNALKDTCLAGGANAKQRSEALAELEKAPSSIRHFIILFRDAGCQYRGLYTFEPDASSIERIHGIGPKTIRNGMIEHFFKYNSGSKRFSDIPTTQHLSVSIDAVSLYQQFWQQRVASASNTPATGNTMNSTMSRSAGPPSSSISNSNLAAAAAVGSTPTKRPPAVAKS